MASADGKHAHSFFGMPKSSAFTMLGAALGMSDSGPSTNGSMSGLVQTGCCLMQAATLQAAMVACTASPSQMLDVCYIVFLLHVDVAPTSQPALAALVMAGQFICSAIKTADL